MQRRTHDDELLDDFYGEVGEGSESAVATSPAAVSGYAPTPYRRAASIVRPLPTAPNLSPSIRRAAGTILTMASRTCASWAEPPVRKTASMSSAVSCAC